MKKSSKSIEGKKILITSGSTVFEQVTGNFIVMKDDRQTEVFLSSGLLSDGNCLDGIEISIESAKDKLIRERFSGIQSIGALGSASKGQVLKASMPGMVKAITVSVGDQVQKNTQVLVLEAMKMENSIMAGYTGVISKIHVTEGMSVEKSALLVEFRNQ